MKMILISRASWITVRKFKLVYFIKGKLLSTINYPNIKREAKNITLNQRILNYLSFGQQNLQNNIKIETVESLQRLKNYDLSVVILNLSNKMNGKELKRTITNLDIECCRRLPDLNEDEIFIFLNNFLSSTPYFVKNLQFYNQALNKMNFCLNNLPAAKLIPICFYAGWQKKSTESQRIIKYCLMKFNNKKLLSEFKLEDIIIICNAAFKTSTQISQNLILQEIKSRIYEQLSILNDESYFITIVKSLRHNYNYDEELLSTISNTMFFNKTLENYNFTALSHILTLYADALYYDEKLTKTIKEYSIKYLKNTLVVTKTKHFSTQLRLKDLSRFLWSLSYLGYEDLKEDELDNLIIPLLNSYINLGNVEENIQEFVGILLSLCTLGYFPFKILPKILKEQLLLKGRHRHTFISRLNLLLTSIRIEQPIVFDTFQITLDPSPSYNITAEIKKRPELRKIHTAVNSLSQKYDFGSVEYSYSVPHLNIVGLALYNKNKKLKAHIEVIDETNSTKYKEIMPHGFMKLKLRLLKSMKRPLVVVDKDDITEMNSSDLVNYLDKKLKISFYLGSR